MNLKVSNQGGAENLNLEMITSKEVKINKGDKSNISDTNTNETKDKYTKGQVDNAIKRLNHFLTDDKTHAEYSVHKDLNRIMIKIIDDETEEVILEVPPENLVDMVAKMCELAGVLVDKKA